MKYVTVFGSARANRNSEYYKKSIELGRTLAEHGYGVVTGGGPGIMEAVNKGAFEAGGASVGLNILLPQEQDLNPYLTESLTFSELSRRKDALIAKSSAFIVAPGGFGTLDELFEVLTLSATRLRHCKIILWDTAFWSPLLDFFHARLLRHGFISPAEMQMFDVCDEMSEIIEKLEE